MVAVGWGVGLAGGRWLVGELVGWMDGWFVGGIVGVLVGGTAVVVGVNVGFVGCWQAIKAIISIKKGAIRLIIIIASDYTPFCLAPIEATIDSCNGILSLPVKHVLRSR